MQTVQAIREACDATVEVLPSDFGGNFDAVDRLLAAEPDVYNHNCETVPRLFREIRGPQADYARTLAMFRRIADHRPAPGIKTGLMLGLGEATDELLDALAELHAAGCRMLTLGQYLQPAPDRLPVRRYVEPAEFDALAAAARTIGFDQVSAGPFVRSSYHARDMIQEA